MARKKIIAGNWKMNMTPSEAVALVCKAILGSQLKNASRKLTNITPSLWTMCFQFLLVSFLRLYNF